MANLVGNSSQDLGELGGVAGTAGVAIGQLGEYAVDGGTSPAGTRLGRRARSASRPVAGVALTYVMAPQAEQTERATASSRSGTLRRCSIHDERDGGHRGAGRARIHRLGRDRYRARRIGVNLRVLADAVTTPPATARGYGTPPTARMPRNDTCRPAQGSYGPKNGRRDGAVRRSLVPADRRLVRLAAAGELGQSTYDQLVNELESLTEQRPRLRWHLGSPPRRARGEAISGLGVATDEVTGRGPGRQHGSDGGERTGASRKTTPRTRTPRPPSTTGSGGVLDRPEDTTRAIHARRVAVFAGPPSEEASVTQGDASPRRSTRRPWDGTTGRSRTPTRSPPARGRRVIQGSAYAQQANVDARRSANCRGSRRLGAGNLTPGSAAGVHQRQLRPDVRALTQIHPGDPDVRQGPHQRELRARHLSLPSVASSDGGESPGRPFPWGKKGGAIHAGRRARSAPPRRNAPFGRPPRPVPCPVATDLDIGADRRRARPQNLQGRQLQTDAIVSALRPGARAPADDELPVVTGSTGMGYTERPHGSACR